LTAVRTVNVRGATQLSERVELIKGIVALHRAARATLHSAAAATAAIPEERPNHPEMRGDLRGDLRQAVHANRTVGSALVKELPPRSTIAGIYPNHVEANAAAAEASEGPLRAPGPLQRRQPGVHLPAPRWCRTPLLRDGPYKNPIDSQGIAAMINSETTSAPI
jgi:hypothetical protein